MAHRVGSDGMHSLGVYFRAAYGNASDARNARVYSVASDTSA